MGAGAAGRAGACRKALAPDEGMADPVEDLDMGPRRSLLSDTRLGRRASKTIEKRISDSLQEDEQEPEHRFEHCRHPAQDALEKIQASEGRAGSKLVSIWGRRGSEKDVFQPYFSHKAMNFDDSESYGRLQHWVGVMCQRGFKPDMPNQDDCLVLGDVDWVLLGVFDGHGSEGHDVSHFVQEHLPKHIMGRLIGKERRLQEWDEACKDAFQAVDVQLKAELPEQSFSSGTTCSVAILSEPSSSEGAGLLHLRVAHLGDSSIIHGCKAAGDSSWQATVLTDPHRPDRGDEAARIHRCGGQIIFSEEPGVCARLLSDGYDLAMSRSMGDFHATPHGMSSEPEIGREVLLKECDEHIILACSDGVWDVIQPVQACQIVAKFAHDDAQKAAEKLVQKAQVRWQEMTGDCVDDITVILVRPVFRSASERAQEEASSLNPTP